MSRIQEAGPGLERVTSWCSTPHSLRRFGLLVIWVLAATLVSVIPAQEALAQEDCVEDNSGDWGVFVPAGDYWLGLDPMDYWHLDGPPEIFALQDEFASLGYIPGTFIAPNVDFQVCEFGDTFTVLLDDEGDGVYVTVNYGAASSGFGEIAAPEAVIALFNHPYQPLGNTHYACTQTIQQYGFSTFWCDVYYGVPLVTEVVQLPDSGGAEPADPEVFADLAVCGADIPGVAEATTVIDTLENAPETGGIDMGGDAVLTGLAHMQALADDRRDFREALLELPAWAVANIPLLVTHVPDFELAQTVSAQAVVLEAMNRADLVPWELADRASLSIDITLAPLYWDPSSTSSEVEGIRGWPQINATANAGGVLPGDLQAELALTAVAWLAGDASGATGYTQAELAQLVTAACDARAIIDGIDPVSALGDTMLTRLGIAESVGGTPASAIAAHHEAVACLPALLDISQLSGPSNDPDDLGAALPGPAAAPAARQRFTVAGSDIERELAHSGPTSKGRADRSEARVADGDRVPSRSGGDSSEEACMALAMLDDATSDFRQLEWVGPLLDWSPNNRIELAGGSGADGLSLVIRFTSPVALAQFETLLAEFGGPKQIGPDDLDSLILLLETTLDGAFSVVLVDGTLVASEESVFESILTLMWDDHITTDPDASSLYATSGIGPSWIYPPIRYAGSTGDVGAAGARYVWYDTFTSGMKVLKPIQRGLLVQDVGVGSQAAAHHSSLADHLRDLRRAAVSTRQHQSMLQFYDWSSEEDLWQVRLTSPGDSAGVFSQFMTRNADVVGWRIHEPTHPMCTEFDCPNTNIDYYGLSDFRLFPMLDAPVERYREGPPLAPTYVQPWRPNLFGESWGTALSAGSAFFTELFLPNLTE